MDGVALLVITAVTAASTVLSDGVLSKESVVFSVAKRGRLPGELLFDTFKDALGDCLYVCLQHTSCLTISYHRSSRRCKLMTDVLFKEDIIDDFGWESYGHFESSLAVKFCIRKNKCATLNRTCWKSPFFPGYTCTTELIQKLVNRNVSFNSVNYPQHYISYNKDNKEVRIAALSDGFISTWLITPGLCGDGISFKALWEPNSYLCQKDVLTYVHPFQRTQVYQLDACFLPVEGNFGVGKISFESVKYAKHYLRHQGYLIKLHAYEKHDLYLKDSTFDELPGLPL